MPDVDDLYGLPLEEFISARAALAKALRAEGRREEAKEIASLRKPSAAAWAVNQLVRTQKRQVRDLFGAGDALQAAQSELLEGRGDAGRLREAGEDERRSVEDLVQAARGLLSGGGGELSRAALDRVSDTLHAAALDPEARAQVQGGRLERELQHVGLGSAGLLPGAATSSRTGGSPERRAPEGKKQPAAREPTPSRSKVDARRKTARREAERAAKAARQGAERAQSELDSAHERRDAAAQGLDEAEAALRECRERARQAEKRLRQAERSLEKTER